MFSPEINMIFSRNHEKLVYVYVFVFVHVAFGRPGSYRRRRAFRPNFALRARKWAAIPAATLAGTHLNAGRERSILRSTPPPRPYVRGERTIRYRYCTPKGVAA